ELKTQYSKVVVGRETVADLYAQQTPSPESVRGQLEAQQPTPHERAQHPAHTPPHEVDEPKQERTHPHHEGNHHDRHRLTGRTHHGGGKGFVRCLGHTTEFLLDQLVDLVVDR